MPSTGKPETKPQSVVAYILFVVVPERHHQQTLAILERIGQLVPNWAAATLLGRLVIGLLVFLVMWPIFGFMDALVLGLIAGGLEAIPYLGPLLSAVPALVFAVTKGGLTPLWVVLVAAPLVAIVDILHDEWYRKRFLPTVTDAELDRLARQALREKTTGTR